MGYKVGQDLILATPDEKFSQVRLCTVCSGAGLYMCCQTLHAWRLAICSSLLFLAAEQLHASATEPVQR